MHDEPLAKTVRINALFDCYHRLLTEKQRTFLQYYYYDDYSLGEIAGEFDISRQAVYEHIKRAEHMLEEYEAKLQIVSKQAERRQLIRRMRKLTAGLQAPQQAAWHEVIDRMEQLDEG